MPLRRRPARVPQHRRARPRRRAVRRGPLRRGRHPRRSGHLLLPRRARVAVVLPLDDRAQHRRARRAEPVRRRRPLPVAAARERDGRSRSWTTARPPSGPRSTTATWRSTRRPGTAAGSGWTGRRAPLDITDEIDGGGHDVRLAFHLGPEVEAELDEAQAVLRWPGAAAPGRRGWNCRASCGGACTEARPTRSSAGTPAVSDSAAPPSRSSATDVRLPASRSSPGWNSSTPTTR